MITFHSLKPAMRPSLPRFGSTAEPPSGGGVPDEPTVPGGAVPQGPQYDEPTLVNPYGFRGTELDVFDDAYANVIEEQFRRTLSLTIPPGDTTLLTMQQIRELGPQRNLSLEQVQGMIQRIEEVRKQQR